MQNGAFRRRWDAHLNNTLKLENSKKIIRELEAQIKQAESQLHDKKQEKRKVLELRKFAESKIEKTEEKMQTIKPLLEIEKRCTPDKIGDVEKDFMHDRKLVRRFKDHITKFDAILKQLNKEIRDLKTNLKGNKKDILGWRNESLQAQLQYEAKNAEYVQRRAVASDLLERGVLFEHNRQFNENLTPLFVLPPPDWDLLSGNL